MRNFYIHFASIVFFNLTTVCTSSMYAQDCTVSTVAGSGSSGYVDAEILTDAKFNIPCDIHFNAAGEIFITDTGNGVIRKINSSGVSTFVTSSTFDEPQGLASDASGNFYVTSGNVIKKITPSGTVTTFAGTGSAGSTDGTGASASFYYPFDIAIDGSDNLFIVDGGNNKIRKITPDGIVSTFAGSGAIGSDDGTGISASFNFPSGIAIDVSGNLYVTERSNHKIRKITPEGVVTTFAGSGTAGYADATGTSAKFNSPSGIAVAGSGNVYIADGGNNRIRKITPSGVVTTLAGTIISGYQDGIGTSAMFSNLFKLSINSSSDLYVTDAHRIRKIVLSKSAQTIPSLPDLIKNYTDGSFTLSKVSTAGLPVQFSSSNSSIVTAAGNSFTITGTGTVVITASQPGNDLYDAATPVLFSLTVNKGNQIITGLSNIDKNNGDPSFNLTGVASSGLSISYTSSDPTVATISDGNVTIVGPGTITITASQSGNENYNEAIPVEITMTVSIINGIESPDNLSNILYPNPVHNELHFAISGLKNIHIVDLNGKLIMNKNLFDDEIDVSSFRQGIYTIEIEQEGKIFRSRLVIQ